MNSRLKGPPLHDSTTRAETYNIKWRRKLCSLADIHYPSQEYAEYLTSTVVFYLGSTFYTFDKDVFLHHLHQFYSALAKDETPTASLWHIQMLLVFALGQALLAKTASPEGPAGVAYFVKAMEALPDILGFYQEPILAIEILCLLALFMQAADMKNGAYGYVSRPHRPSVPVIDHSTDWGTIDWSSHAHSTLSRPEPRD